MSGSPKQAKHTGSHGAYSAPAATGGQTVTLVKGAHRWLFSCGPGEESSLLASLSELAAAAGVPFDYFDAALVSHQIAQRLKPGLRRVDGAGDSVR
ncbi:MAG: hypothetical protein KF745_02325 [Phycisphaeraceae bacterium]|nr:hypothetical protein [Phycisphaeraceae bacterium]